ncbi:hypothetical protein HX037_04910 [Ignatzschineria indica]|uniref:hypothetical protein n=1 Tax=Ignatzschineria indica TaxID=472583 RepID=UPI002575B26F|nr:hypothetical protein [Ignatzschineria indica]MDM1545221.1 hypothetical protein [Ignatzschineria indica]
MLPKAACRQEAIFYCDYFLKQKRLNGAGSYYRVLPEIARRQVAIICHRKLSHSIAITLGIKDAKWRACMSEKNEMVGSRRSKNLLIEPK